MAKVGHAARMVAAGAAALALAGAGPADARARIAWAALAPAAAEHQSMDAATLSITEGWLQLLGETVARCAGLRADEWVAPRAWASEIAGDRVLAERWPLGSADRPWLTRAGRLLGADWVASGQAAYRGAAPQVTVRMLSVAREAFALEERYTVDGAALGDQLADASRAVLRILRAPAAAGCQRTFDLVDVASLGEYVHLRQVDAAGTDAMAAFARREPAMALALGLWQDAASARDASIAHDATDPHAGAAATKWRELAAKERDPKRFADKWQKLVAGLVVERRFGGAAAYARHGIENGAKTDAVAVPLWIALIGAEQALRRRDDVRRDARAFADRHPNARALASVQQTIAKLDEEAAAVRDGAEAVRADVRSLPVADRRDLCRVGRMHRGASQWRDAKLYLLGCLDRTAAADRPAVLDELVPVLTELGQFAEAQRIIEETTRAAPKAARRLRSLANALPIE